jgi:hypothetical protein
VLENVCFYCSVLAIYMNIAKKILQASIFI